MSISLTLRDRRLSRTKSVTSRHRARDNATALVVPAKWVQQLCNQLFTDLKKVPNSWRANNIKSKQFLHLDLGLPTLFTLTQAVEASRSKEGRERGAHAQRQAHFGLAASNVSGSERERERERERE